MVFSASSWLCDPSKIKLRSARSSIHFYCLYVFKTRIRKLLIHMRIMQGNRDNKNFFALFVVFNFAKQRNEESYLMRCWCYDCILLAMLFENLFSKQNWFEWKKFSLTNFLWEKFYFFAVCASFWVLFFYFLENQIWLCCYRHYTLYIL